MEIENVLKATLPVILGVLIAGYIMAALGPSVSLIETASQGYGGQGA
jgi:hypothetical protein